MLNSRLLGSRLRRKLRRVGSNWRRRLMSRLRSKLRSRLLRARIRALNRSTRHQVRRVRVMVRPEHDDGVNRSRLLRTTASKRVYEYLQVPRGTNSQVH
jgi:hypothetical protein